MTINNLQSLFHVVIRNTAIVNLHTKFFYLSAEQKQIKLIVLCIFYRRKVFSSSLALQPLLLLHHVPLKLLQSLLFKNQLLCGFIQLVNMVAQVLRCCELKQICVEGWHVRLDVVEEESLQQMTSVDS